MNEERIEKIRQALELAFKPSVLEVEDESHLHAGHAGAETGLGHFQLKIVSKIFAGQSLIQTHKAIYQALGDLMTTDIHALTINAKAERK